IVSGRADELARRPDVWNTLLQLDRIGLLQRVDLRELTEEECADLVRRILRMRQPAPRFSARLYEATGSNPFFMLQALRALQEQGMLTRDAQGVWHTPWDAPHTDYHDLPMPAGLRDAIDGRLRELPPQQRAALAAEGARRRNEPAIEAAARAGAEAAGGWTRGDIQRKRGEVATSLGEYPTAIAADEGVWLLTGQGAGAPNAAARAGTRRGAQI